MGREFTAASAKLTLGHGVALDTNFSTPTGDYFLAIPIDREWHENNSGRWLKPGNGLGRALELPKLVAGWNS